MDYERKSNVKFSPLIESHTNWYIMLLLQRYKKFLKKTNYIS